MSARPALLHKPEAGSAHEADAPPAAGPAPVSAELPRFLANGRAQGRLEVGARDDPLEHEADAVAEAVVEGRPALPRFLGGGRHASARRAAPDAPLPAVEDRPAPAPLQCKPEPHVNPPDDGQPRGAGSGDDKGGGGAPLPPPIKGRLETSLGADLAAVRVHQGARAASLNARIGARAFTTGRDIWLGARERSDDLPLMAHETAHVLQQAQGDRALRRQPAEGAAGGGGASQSFAFSEDEMEARLSSTPAEGVSTAADTVELAPGTETALNEVEQGGGEGHGAGAGGGAEGGEGGGAEGAEGGEHEAGEGEGEGGGAEHAGGEHAGGAAAGTVEAGGPEAQPGPATEFENLVGEQVAAYLDGNLSNEGLAALDPQTRGLLEAADALGTRTITDPEAAALQGLGGEGLQPGAQPTGYENEPLWLRTLAGIRDVCGQLGGIVGIIGLAATVSGFILSLLIPPVGAFLLTVGRFCDIAALILDGISLVLGIILTGYNYYRLKNETDPEERRRLLGMVRQDAMGTVMSAVAVATAVAPGAARVLGRSRVGRLAGRAVRGAGGRVASAAGRLAAQPGRLGRTAAALGRAGSATAGAVRRAAGGVSGRFHTFMGRTRDFGLRTALSSSRLGRSAVGRLAGRSLGAVGGRVGALARSSAGRLLGRGAGAVGGGLRRLGRGVATSSAGRWLAGSRLGRYARRVYGENLDLARLLYASSERAHHGFVGGRLRAELAAAQRAGPITEAAARARLQQRLPASAYPEINFNDLALRTDRATGQLVFGRPGSRLQRFLDGLRRNEANTINNMMAANPALTDADIARLLNERPNAPARWTEAEVWAFRQQASRSAVLKTPHHTISVLDAPHLAYDPRYIQLANAPLVTPRGTTRATSPWTRFGEGAARRPPGGAGAALDVPFVRTTNEAEALAHGGPAFGTGGPSPRPLTGNFDPDYFRSEAFFDALRREGNTGVWVNPNDPSQRLLFDAHFVAGHRWQTGEAGARGLFGPEVEFAGRFEGAVPRTLIDRSVSGLGRLAARESEPGQAVGAAVGDWLLAALGVGGTPANAASPAPAAAAAEEAPAAAEGESAAVAAPEAEAAAAPEVEAAATLEAEAPAAPAGAGTHPTAAPTAAQAPAPENTAPAPAAAGEGPAEPPSPVPYSPQALVSVREQRIDIAGAIEAVNAYIGETGEAERHNLDARDAAAGLRTQNQRQQEFAAGERATVATEQGKLEQASGAQQDMAAQSAEAQSEASRGEQEGNSVQSEGQGVSVEPKPEEPRSRSWLERAWDATAGALYDNLIAPAVRAVRRKVNQVMSSINEFIMGMINQALGLDEIEAEINGGGEDISARQGSLGETDTGLQETEAQAASEAERNQQSMAQADLNVEDARATREDAVALRGELRAQDQTLAAEEVAGRSYIVDFESSYQPWFEPVAPAAGGEVGEMEVAASEEVLPSEENEDVDTNIA